MTTSDISRAFPVGAHIRVTWPNVDAHGHVFDHGVIDGEPVAYIHMWGGGNAALTTDSMEVIA